MPRIFLRKLQKIPRKLQNEGGLEENRGIQAASLPLTGRGEAKCRVKAQRGVLRPYRFRVLFFFPQSRKEKRPCAKHPARLCPHLEHDFEDETIYRIQHHPVHPINP
jgi:hypothetical protein